MSSSELEVSGLIEKLDEAGFAYVRTVSETGCSSCGMSGGCGTSVLANFFTGRAARNLIKVPNILDRKVGDRVELRLPGEQLLLQAFMAYMVPLIGLLLGAFLGEAYLQLAGETGVLLGAVFGLISAWVGVRWLFQPSLPQMKG